MIKNKNLVPGAQFKAKAKVFHPTALSVALADAGIIPGTHIVGEKANEVFLRDRNDTLNERPSYRAAF